MKHLKNTRSLVIIGMLGALATILSMIEIPFPPAPYLKFELSEIPVLIAATIGAVPMFIVIALRGLIKLLIGWNTTTNVYGLAEIASTFASLAMGLAFIFARKIINKNFLKRDVIIADQDEELVLVDGDYVSKKTKKTQKVVFINKNWQNKLMKISFYLSLVCLILISILTLSAIVSEVLYDINFNWNYSTKLFGISLRAFYIFALVVLVIAGPIYLLFKHVLDIAYFLQSIIVISSLIIVMIIVNYIFLTPSFIAQRYTLFTTFVDEGGSSAINSENYLIFMWSIIALYTPFNLLKGCLTMIAYRYIRKLEVFLAKLNPTTRK